MKTGVYQIRHLASNKRYVGSAAGKRGFNHRWNTHRRLLETNKHHSLKLQNAWNKYGHEAFVFEILEECKPEQCIDREQHYLNGLLFASRRDDRFDRVGYNISREARRPPGMAGKTHSNKTKQVISQKAQGRVVSEESKQRMSRAAKQRFEISENHPMSGKTHTESAKRKISQAGIGRKVSDQCRERLREVHRGERNANSKLTKQTVKKIKSLILDGEKTSVIARQFDVSQSSISDIKTGRTWRHITW